MISLAFDRRIVARPLRPDNANPLRRLRKKLAEVRQPMRSDRWPVALHGPLAVRTEGA